MIRAIFFDIDGTLFDNRARRFSPSSAEALRKLKEKNPELLLFLSTARPYDSFRRIGTLDLGIPWDGYIASSGSLVVLGGRIVHMDEIHPLDVRLFIKTARTLGLSFEIVMSKKRIRIGGDSPEAIEFYSHFEEGRPPFRAYGGEMVTTINLFSDPSTDKMMERMNPRLTFDRYTPFSVDVISRPHNKGPAVSLLLAELGLVKEEAMGFGDDVTDLGMAASVGTFVAMGNAKEELKKAAAYVAKPVDEEGVLDGLEKFGLLGLL